MASLLVSYQSFKLCLNGCVQDWWVCLRIATGQSPTPDVGSEPLLYQTSNIKHPDCRFCFTIYLCIWRHSLPSRTAAVLPETSTSITAHFRFPSLRLDPWWLRRPAINSLAGLSTTKIWETSSWMLQQTLSQTAQIARRSLLPEQVCNVAAPAKQPSTVHGIVKERTGKPIRLHANATAARRCQ